MTLTRSRNPAELAAFTCSYGEGAVFQQGGVARQGNGGWGGKQQAFTVSILPAVPSSNGGQNSPGQSGAPSNPPHEHAPEWEDQLSSPALTRPCPHNLTL